MSAERVLEVRKARPGLMGAARVAAMVSAGSALWAYLEYARADRESALALALAGVCFGIGATFLFAFRGTFPVRTVQGTRPPWPATEKAVDLGARRGLIVVLGAALSGLFAVVLLPLRSLGPWPSKALHRTAWRRGVRLVTTDGAPLRPSELARGSATIVVPQGAPDDPNSVAVLVKLHGSGALRAYSRICTHAGCAVCVFLRDRSELVCPCHHSVFDAAGGGKILSGPASRPLPELPLTLDPDGTLVADGDFDRPIGPLVG